MNRKDSNRFKIIYENLNQPSINHIQTIQKAAFELSTLYTINNKEMHEALMRLEESIMWAIKSVCVKNEVNNE